LDAVLFLSSICTPRYVLFMALRNGVIMWNVIRNIQNAQEINSTGKRALSIVMIILDL